MADDGTSYEIDIPVNAAGVEPAAAAVARLADQLTASAAATAAASDAMKAGQAAYTQAETNADRAAKALEKIGLQADAQKTKLAALAAGTDGAVNIAAYQKAEAKLAALNARQTEAQAKATAAAAAMSAAATSLDTLRGTAAAAADNEARLTAAMKSQTAAAAASAKAAKEQAAAEQQAAKQAAAAAAEAAKNAKNTGDAGEAAGKSSINFRALSSGLGKLGGPLGSVGSQAAGVGGALQKLSKALGAAGPYVAAAVLAVALAAAFVVAGLAITKFAVSAADTARTSALLSAGIAGSVAGGLALDKTFSDLANKVPLTRDELSGMASDLAKTGLKGDALSAALETAAVKAAKLKFGPEFKKELISLPNQAARLKSNFNSLFSGLNIEGLLEGLAKMVALFDANSASGKAIKVVFESMFQPVVDGLTAIIPKAIATFLKLEILALQGLIAIKPYGGVLQAIAIGFGIVGAVVLGVVAIFVAAGIAMTAAFALIIALPFLISDGFKSMSASVTGAVGGAVDWVTGKFNQVIAFLQGLSFSEIGKNLIMGLITGITSAGPGVLSAITGIADGAIGAAKKALGIASPSKVFAEIGGYTAQGMSQGVDSGATDVQASLQSLVAVPAQAPAAAGGAAPAKASSSGTAGAGGTYVITINGGDGPSIASALRDLFADLGVQAATGEVPA